MAFALSQEEEKNRKIAAAVSVVMHAIILLLLIYLLAWRAPDPPAAEIGIELNFGLDAVGSGNVQSQAMPNPSKVVEDSKPAPTQPDPLPEPQPVAKATPTPPTPVETPKVVTTTADAPVAVKEEVKAQPKPVPPKEEVKKVVEAPKEEVKKEVEKPKSLYPGKPTESTGTGKAGTASTATGNNNGDDANTVGDKGDPAGSLEAKAMMGKPGGGGGGNGLDLPGWRYDIAPKKDPYENETGFVKFRIKIDGQGNMISVDRIEGTVSPHVEKWYLDQLRKTTFSRTGGSGPSSGASGVVTFVIRSR
jgi:periplasmic protein TonB